MLFLQHCLLEKRMLKAIRGLPDKLFYRGLHEYTFCPVTDSPHSSYWYDEGEDSENDYFDVVGGTFPTGNLDGRGYGAPFFGNHYGPKEWYSHIQVPGMVLMFLILVRVGFYKSLHPIIIKSSNATTFKWLPFLVHIASEVLWWYFVYHVHMNNTGWRTPKRLHREPHKLNVLNLQHNGGSVVVRPGAAEASNVLQYQLIGLKCQGPALLSMIFINGEQYASKPAGVQAQIDRDDRMYHHGILLRCSMEVTVAMVLMSIILGALAQLIDYDQKGWLAAQTRMVHSNPPSPRRHQREDRALELLIADETATRVLRQRRPRGRD